MNTYIACDLNTHSKFADEEIFKVRCCLEGKAKASAYSHNLRT